MTCYGDILDGLQTFASEFQIQESGKGVYSWFTETESLTGRCKAVLEGESLVEIYYRTFLADQGEGS